MGDRDIPDSESLALAQAAKRNNPEVGDLLKTSSGNSGSNTDANAAGNAGSNVAGNNKENAGGNPDTKSASSVELLKKSSAALEKLASTNSATNLPPGTAPDSAPTIPPITQEAKKEVFQPNLNDAANANFTIQAGAFLNEDNAKKLSERFKKDGYYSKLGVKNVGGADFNIVYIGRFRTEEDGKLILDYLKDNHRIYGRIIPIEE
jgi:cell division septation protein DedD